MRILLSVWMAVVAITGTGWSGSLDNASTGNPYQEALAYNADTGGVSLLIMKDGKIVAEEYANRGGPNRAWPLASGTKSFAGTIAALAVEDGLLTLDEPVSQTIDEWAEGDRATITIRQLLTLSSGLETPSPLANAQMTQKEAVALPLVREPGTHFAYGPSPFLVFAELMDRKLSDQNTDAVSYLIAEVFEPLDIRPRQWGTTRDREKRLASGARLTARDWARFGEFIRLGGRLDGKQVLAPAALKAFGEGTAANPGYGLTWWLNTPLPGARTPNPRNDSADLYADPRARNLPDDLLMAAGAGNQRLYIIPSEAMVVVRQAPLRSDNADNAAFSDVTLLTLILAP